ncbi:MAG: class I tRNA ligase family protein [Cytophagaceae bacterium]|nr:class I tRNA ligase family protein [Cytophagaceae bacterium]
MNFNEYKALDYAAVADEILAFWQENGIFEASVSQREGQPSFTFYEGPPSANGSPGIHHVMARTIKDVFCRYQTLKGNQVKRKGGWDTHGLPIELQVEKELGITKEDIGKTISIADYNQKCREAVMKFTDQWNTLTERMGYWVDLEHPYVTYENEYIETLWYLLKELYNKGLLYKGYTIQPYSPAAGTGLSSHELNMPGTYKEIKDVSIVAQFKVKLTGKSAYLFDAASTNYVYILAWTTTPWTLPANSALTVGKNIDYALVKTLNPYTYLPVNVVLAKDRVLAYFSEKGQDADFTTYHDGDKLIPWTVVMNIKGAHLEGVEYEQLLPYVTPEIRPGTLPAFRVISGDFVTTEDGTGVVHTSPTFGADDFRVARQTGIPSIMVKDETGKEVPIVDKRGRFVAEITDFAGEFVKEQYLSDEEKEAERVKQAREKYLSVDERIGIKLKTENKAFNVQKFDHPYPHCWRTDKPVLYYPLDSWFIRTTAVKDKLIALNKTINWKPESTGTGRFGNWLENLVDWNLSRSRYWGTPLPIWRSEDGEEVCIGSIAELESSIKHALKDDALSEEQRAANEMFLAKIVGSRTKPHPRPFSDGEGGNALVDNVFTANEDAWRILKEYGRSNRKAPTKAEDTLWQVVRNNNLGVKFRRQYAIGVYIADFVSIPARLVVEVDGEIHQTADYPQYDQARTEYLKEAGFDVIRFTNEEVLNETERVKNSIQAEAEKLLHQRTPSPSERGPGGEALDLHRPYVDEIYLVSPSGKVMTRELDLIDVWFDSGAMPYAQWHYPFENKEIFEKSYPADFISEGVDQTRGWFFTLHALSTLLNDSVAFKNVLSTGLVLDKNGNKMSKRLGNAADPFKTLDQYGADPVRWYMATNANPWDNLRFNLDGVTEVRNKFFGTLTNTYAFFALYANVDGYELNEFDRLPHEKLPELDRWILSKLNSLIKDVDAFYADYDVTKAGRAIQDFVTDQLSNWYLRLSRRRFWRGGLTEDKRAGYETLQHCLVTVSQLMSPIAPFYADWLYRNMTNHIRGKAKAMRSPLRHESVHLTTLHPAESEHIDPELEASMDLAQRVSSLVHSIRKVNRLKVRQPLSRVLIPVLNADVKRQLARVEDLIKAEVNVKAVEYLDDASGILNKKVKPNFKTLGPKFGPKMKEVANGIQAMTATDIAELEKNGQFLISNFQFLINLEDVEIQSEDLPGFLTAQEAGLTVALDVTLTDDLRHEGIARDFVNRIQNVRKDQGFDVTDRITISVKTPAELVKTALEANREYICTETQALSLNFLPELHDAVVVDMDEYQLEVRVEVV